MTRRLRAEQLRANRRVDPVRADQRIARLAGAAGERDADAAVALLEALHLAAGLDLRARGARAADQRRVEVGAVDPAHGGAQPARHLLQRPARQQPSMSGALLEAAQDRPALADLCAQAEPIED